MHTINSNKDQRYIKGYRCDFCGHVFEGHGGMWEGFKPTGKKRITWEKFDPDRKARKGMNILPAFLACSGCKDERLA